MTLKIRTITTPFVFNVSVNCYLIRTGDGYTLIDTGRTNKRGTIEKELTSAGCRPGNLELIVLTHGDFDHCGMVERGDMLWNRKPPNILIRTVFGLLFRLSKSDRFKPDLYVEDGYDLSEYGFDAQVLHIPGHSKGSIGILTTGGDLFCGDLLANVDKPELWSIIDDSAAANASVEKLEKLDIKTVYPGHGKPFPMEQFTRNSQ
jgi:hydroxyacylglutathione hydrolase